MALLIMCGFSVYAAQTEEELTGEPVKSFYNDFESYETIQYTNPSRPSRYQYTYRITNGPGSTLTPVYTGNAAENIPLFNNKTISDTITLNGTSINPLVLYKPALPSLQYTAISNTVYTAEGPGGNVIYGGLPGYYGWYGGGLFNNYPDPYSTGFSANIEPHTSLRSSEKRLAVINEITSDYSSNKLLIMDARYRGDGSDGDSQVAVFGKHNLDFEGSSEIKFRLYPYVVDGNGQGFRVFLTRGVYTLSYEPTFTYVKNDEINGHLSSEHQAPEHYKGSYFSDEQKFQLLRFSNYSLNEEAGIKSFNIADSPIRVAGYKLISTESAPRTMDSDARENKSPDVYYDIQIIIERYEGLNRLYVNINDNNGELVYTTAVNGIAPDVPALGEFFDGASGDDRFGIVFEAYSGKYYADGRTKMGIDNLSFSKNEYAVHNAWLMDDGGTGTINFDVCNFTENDTNADEIVAIYDNTDKSLVTVLYKPIQMAPKEGGKEKIIESIKLPDDFDKTKNKVKLFVWKADTNSLTPLLETVEINDIF